MYGALFIEAVQHTKNSNNKPEVTYHVFKMYKLAAVVWNVVEDSPEIGATCGQDHLVTWELCVLHQQHHVSQ